MEIPNNNNNNLKNHKNNAIGKYGPTYYSSSSRYNKVDQKNDHYKHHGYWNEHYYNKLPNRSSSSHFYNNYYERFNSNKLEHNNYNNIRKYSNSKSEKCSSRRKYYNNKFYMTNQKYNQNYYTSNRYANNCSGKKSGFNSQSFQNGANGTFSNRASHLPSNSNRFTFSSQTSNSTFDYGRLPIVALSKIYSFLNLKDRLNASSTCKQWRAGLFDPRLWNTFHLTIYLCNRDSDLKSAYFKANFLLNYVEHLSIKYDPNDLLLFEHLIVLLNYSNNINLKHLSIQPILNTYFYEDYDDHCYYNSSEALSCNLQRETVNEKQTENQSNKRLFKLLNKIILNSKCIEHLSLGCIGDFNRSNCNFEELVSNLAKKHLISLKSIHLSTINNSSVLTLASSPSSSSSSSHKNNHPKKSNQLVTVNNSFAFNSNNMYLSNSLGQFVNLNVLSLDYDDLTDQFLRSSVCLNSMKK
jgi:hypothetical protein